MGLFEGMLTGAGEALFDVGKMSFANEIQKERDAASALRDEHMMELRQTYQTSERIAGQEYRESERIAGEEAATETAEVAADVAIDAADIAEGRKKVPVHDPKTGRTWDVTQSALGAALDQGAVRGSYSTKKKTYDLAAAVHAFNQDKDALSREVKRLEALTKGKATESQIYEVAIKLRDSYNDYVENYTGTGEPQPYAEYAKTTAPALVSKLFGTSTATPGTKSNKGLEEHARLGIEVEAPGVKIEAPGAAEIVPAPATAEEVSTDLGPIRNKALLIRDNKGKAKRRAVMGLVDILMSKIKGAGAAAMRDIEKIMTTLDMSRADTKRVAKEAEKRIAERAK